MREEFDLPETGPAISHYTDAVRFGDTLYVSGLVGWDADGRVGAPGDAAAQTRRIFESLRAILDRAGCGPEDVLKVTFFLTDIDDRARINPVRQEFFGDARPASTLVQVAALVLPELCVEMECVVGIPDRR